MFVDSRSPGEELSQVRERHCLPQLSWQQGAVCQQPPWETLCSSGPGRARGIPWSTPTGSAMLQVGYAVPECLCHHRPTLSTEAFACHLACRLPGPGKPSSLSTQPEDAEAHVPSWASPTSKVFLPGRLVGHASLPLQHPALSVPGYRGALGRPGGRKQREVSLFVTLRAPGLLLCLHTCETEL